MAEEPLSSSPAPEPDPDRTPHVWRRFQLPAGLLPRYTQHAGLALLALLMVVIMLLTARPTPPTKSTAPLASPLTDGQQTRIQDFQRRLQEEAERLAREQAELALAKQAFARTTPPSPPPDAWTSPAPSTAPAIDSLEQERRQREERARFADNVAFRRESTTPTPVLTSTSAPARDGKPEAMSTGVSDGHHRLLEGTLVETVLTNRLDGTFAGPVNCLVTTPIYARDGETLLIPAGARFLGTVKPVTQMDQARLAVAFHRITFPNGRSVKLDLVPGLNQVGDTALRDQVNRHYWQTFGASAAVGALAGLSLAQTRYGIDTTSADVYRQGMATSVANSSTRILDRYLNQLPTVTIREGHPVIVYLTADLDLPAYRADASAISQEP